MHVEVGYISGFTLKVEGGVGQQAAYLSDELTLLPIAALRCLLKASFDASWRASSYSSRAFPLRHKSLQPRLVV